jgi:filamentous hemagglutinin family protein
MSLLRRAVVLLVLFTQVWTPVLAQTLPMQVDKSARDHRPFIGVTRGGLPVVNIAPPTAAGVSNNRYIQFNVGRSGAILNNSGAASESQLAGRIGGNPLLGNRHATTILNQVTANNPSQLRGMLEVAGHRANVIIANPAGILCDGCGFANANRASLTTGRPMLGIDGGLRGFDVTRGHLSIDGLGLDGLALSQVDLIARSLTVNASVWADRLNVVTGPAQVGYADDSVRPQAGEGMAPTVSLDLAALGGMYVNSIRLIGTEAGVGVNIGGTLVLGTGGRNNPESTLGEKVAEYFRSVGRGASNVWDIVVGSDTDTHADWSSQNSPRGRSPGEGGRGGDESRSMSDKSDARSRALPPTVEHSRDRYDGLLPRPQDSSPTLSPSGRPSDPVTGPTLPGYETMDPTGPDPITTPHDGPIKVAPLSSIQDPDDKTANNSRGVKSGVPGVDFTPNPDIVAPYTRPRGVGPTTAQRASVQGKPCVDCGETTERQVADHIDPLVVQYYRDGAVDVLRQNSLEAVQPHCPGCSSTQGGQLGAFSKAMKKLFRFGGNDENDG